MADQRLVMGLTAWLRDSDVPAPDVRMSASRVMAGMETTERLGRFWPPARLAPAIQPAPALGEFGPILVFAGTTRMHTEVLPSTVFLELSVGDVESAVAVSLLMVMFALLVLVAVRVLAHKSVGRVA